VKEFKRTFLREFLDTWSICGTECGACFYRGPIVPHNWLVLPPHEWAPPLEKCPSYEFFKFKAYSGVGRGDLASIVHDDPDFVVTDDLMQVIYTCTGCGMCSEICYKLRPLSAIFAIREELVERGGRLPDPLPRLDANVDESGNRFGTARPLHPIEGLPREGEDLYFAGCVARYQRPESVRATSAILQCAGIDIAYLNEEETCCGLIPGHDGSTRILEKQAARNIEAFARAGAKRVIVSCAHCYKTLKVDYALIAGELPFEVVHVAELFFALVAEKRIVFNRPVERKLTYHDPCHLGRYFHVIDEPREVLRSIPGVELVEMEPHGKWAHCCGSGTKITSACYPEFTAAVTDKRLEEGRQAAATVVTACTTCYQHMGAAARAQEDALEVLDLPLLVAEAMGLAVANADDARGNDA
jgi:heterodisulfide reductase subunit D